MDRVTGNAYDPGLSFMNSADRPYMSSLVSTSTNTLCPITAVDPVPEHPVPPFAAHPRPYQAAPFGIYGADTKGYGNSNTQDQSLHRDYTTERESGFSREAIHCLNERAGTRDVLCVDLLVGQGSPLVTESELSLHSIEQGDIPLSDFPCLLLPNNALASSMETFLPVGGLDPLDSVLQELSVGNIPRDVLNSLRSGSDGESAPQHPFEGVDVCPPPCTTGRTSQSSLQPISDVTHLCDTDVLLYSALYPSGDNMGHAVSDSQHLYQVFHLFPSNAKCTQSCPWRGCAKELEQENITSHILTVHLHFAAGCKAWSREQNATVASDLSYDELHPTGDVMNEERLPQVAPFAIHHYYTCGWTTGSVVCSSLVQGSDFPNHLRFYHGVSGPNEARLACRWVGCFAKMKRESLARHINEKHLQLKYACLHCPAQFSRSRVLQNHISKRHSGN